MTYNCRCGKIKPRHTIVGVVKKGVTVNMLKKRREELHLTQQQVAEKAGMPLRTYQSYELGVRIPNVISAIKLSEALNSDVTKLFNTEPF